MMSNSEPRSRAGKIAALRTSRVIVFHRRPLVANGLASLLAGEPGIEVVAVLSRPGELRGEMSTARPDVVVLGCADRGQSRADRLVSRMVASDHGVPALILVLSGDDATAGSLTVDAAAVVTTDVAGHTLCELVRGARDQASRSVPSELIRPLAARPPRTSLAPATTLTSREYEVLRGIESGLSTKEIAAGLGISVNTTRTHAQRLMSKMRVHSRLQAAALAADQRSLILASGRRT